MPRVAWAITIALLTGCGAGGVATVRERASMEWRCPVGQVEVEEMSAQAFLASGCGRRVTYICLINSFGEAMTCEADTDSSPETPGSSRETVALASSWSDEAVRGLLRTTNDHVLACFPSEHPAFDLRVQIAESGRITHSRVLAGAATEDEQRCVTGVFGAVSVEGRASRPRIAVLHFVPGVHAPHASEPEPTSGGHATAIDPATSIAARLEEHHDAILACADASRIGVSASWDEEGNVTLSLRGEQVGGAEERCIRSAVGTIRIEPAPSAAGSMVHPVTD